MNSKRKKLIRVDKGFRAGTLMPEEEMNCFFYDGGLGDHICRLSAVKYILDECKHVTLHVWVPNFFASFAKWVFPSADIRAYEDSKNYNDKIAGLQGGGHAHTSIKAHLIDHAFNVLVDRQVEIEYKNYIQMNPIDVSHFNLPDKYIVITSGFTAEVREMIPKTFNELSEYVINKGYIPVYLGNEKAVCGSGSDIIGTFKCDFNKGINLVNKTSLIEAHGIISGSKMIVGLDNGLLHLAGMTQIPIVMGFTTVEPRLRMPYRNNQLGWNVFPVVPDDSLPCRFCQSKWAMVYDFDFRFCWYQKNGLDKEIKCVNNLTSDKYIEQMEKILK